MAFTGVDSVVSSIAGGKVFRGSFTRTIDTGATSAAGRWHSCITTGGTGGAMTVTGTAGAGIVMTRSTAGALPLNANVTPDLRHLVSLYAQSPAATAVPGSLLLTDIIHIYPSCVLTGTPTTLSNHPTWTGTGDTRMTNAIGVQCSLLVTTATTAGNGQITITYADQDNNAATAGSLYAPSATTPTGCFYGATNTAATVGGIYMPLAAGDTGVRQVTSYAVNVGATSGVGCFILHRPIAEIPLVAANTPAERSFLSDPFLIPRVFDDACLALFVKVGGALTAGNVLEGAYNCIHG